MGEEKSIVMQDNWIKVADRLPETDDDVLVIYCKGNNVSRSNAIRINIGWMDYETRGKWNMVERDGVKMDVDGNDGNYHGGDMWFITHWMPLPELPITE